MSTNYQLGDRVTFTHTLHRRGRHTTSTNRFGRELEQWRKEWTTERWPGDQATPKRRSGIVIGKRTLVNGDRDYIGYEEGYGFIPREYVTAYVVAYDMRRRPVYVLPAHLTAEETSDA